MRVSSISSVSSCYRPIQHVSNPATVNKTTQVSFEKASGVDTFFKCLGGVMGGGSGAIIGLAFGGPIGAIIGAVIGGGAGVEAAEPSDGSDTSYIDDYNHYP